MSSTTTTVVPDLMSVIHRQITPEAVRAMASRLGEDRERTAAAVSAGIPSVLTALSDVARSETGADYLKEIVDEKRDRQAPAGESTAVLLDATAGSGNAHEASLLDDELGQRSWTISDAVAEESGIRRESAHRLLGGVASVAVRAVADSAGDLSAGGLRSLLNSQRREWVSRLPQPIASAFETPPGSLAAAPLPRGAHEPPVFEPPPRSRVWVLPVLLALAAILFIPLVRGARRGAERARTPGSPVATHPIATNRPAPATNPTPVDTPAATLRAAAPSPDTPVGRDQMVSGLAVYLAAPATEVTMPQRFTLPSLGFESGATEPSSAGAETLNQISALLQAHPSAAVRIESFTDNVGRPEDNLDLSRRRSEEVKALLVQDGADATRIEVSGLGQQRPIASNATDVGRRLNRRTELVVTQR
jgi:outer membrane protein OmpA-like peptidoglycan-associated protein